MLWEVVLNLYDYQKKVIVELYRGLKTASKGLLIAPTGSGKTVISSAAIAAARSKGRECWFLVHRDELIAQARTTLEAYGLPNDEIGVIKAGYEGDIERPIQLASIQTLTARNILPPKGAVVFFDEAHTNCFYEISRRIIETHEGFIIGVTATPWRAKRSEGMALMFDFHVMAPPPIELTKKGFLCPSRLFGFSTFDLSKVRKQYGDFNKGDLEKACNTNQSNQTIVKETSRFIGERTGIVFATCVSHAEELSRLFNERGLSCACIAADTKLKDRAVIYDQLKMGEIRLIVSVGVLTEGFDVKSISVLVIARPTKSWALYVQMVGRGLRTSPGKKDCLVLDFAENFKAFGNCSLITREQMAPDYPDPFKGEAPCRFCHSCQAVSPVHEKFCLECGFEFPLSKPIQKKELFGHLVEIKLGDEKGTSSRRRDFYGQILLECYQKAMSPDYARKKFLERFRRNPMKLEKFQAAFRGNVDHKLNYWNYLTATAARLNKPKTWAVNHFRYEFGELKRV